MNTMGTTARSGLVAAAVSVLLLAACSGSTSETTESVSGAVSVATTPATESTPTTITAVTEPPAPEAETPPELSLADVFAPIATEPTEGGPRPLLAWEAVDGVAAYQVVVLGTNGEPYWAWSGTETRINVGGNPEPDALGAWVHEPMTWTVSAHGPNGEVLGLSAPATLEP